MHITTMRNRERNASQYDCSFLFPPQVRVTVRVDDVNDCAPEIDINYLASGTEDQSRGTVEEGNSPATVAMVTVTDRDSGPGGQVVCKVAESAQNSFYLEDFSHVASQGIRLEGPLSKKKQYKLMSRGSFDREKTPLITFPIHCVDNNNVSTGPDTTLLSSSVMVDILVKDSNDETPTFVKTLFTFKLSENHPRLHRSRPPKPVIIGRVTAVDKDEGINAKITYSIEASAHSRAFRINPSTGVIAAVTPFDRELMNHVTFKVTATDHGVKPKSLSSTAFVRVEILDENDSPPVFSQKHYHFEVVENSPSLLVGPVTATDKDDKGFAAIRYRLERQRGGLSDSRYFSINPSSGMLQVGRDEGARQDGNRYL